MHTVACTGSATTYANDIFLCDLSMQYESLSYASDIVQNELVHSPKEHLCQPLLYCYSSSRLKWPNGTKKQTDLLNWRIVSNARSASQSPVQWHVKEKRRADQTTVAFWYL